MSRMRFLDTEYFRILHRHRRPRLRPLIPVEQHPLLCHLSLTQNYLDHQRVNQTVLSWDCLELPVYNKS